MGINYSPKIVTDGLVLALDASNPKSYPGSGTTWFDLSGNGNNGTLTNGVGYDSANVGSLSFDGANDYVILQGNPNVDGVENLTICTIFNKNSSGSILSKRAGCPDGAGSPGNNRSIQLTANTDNGLTFTYPLGTGGSGPAGRNGTNVTVNNILSSNEWVFASVTFDSSNIILYTNGIEVYRETPTVSTVLKSAQSLRIGSSWSYCTGVNAPEALFTGKISYIITYEKTLTAQEIQQNFNATRGRYGI